MRCAVAGPWVTPGAAAPVSEGAAVGPRTMANTGADTWTAGFALAIAAAALGYAIQIKNGNYNPEALIWLSVAIVGCAVAAWNGAYRRIEAAGAAAVLGVIAGEFFIQIVPLMTAKPGTEVWVPPLPFYHMAAVAIGVTALGFMRVRAARWALPLLLLTHLFMGAWVIRHTPRPLIDVHVVQQAGCEALAHGQNPYAVRPADIYGPACRWYPAGTVKDGHLTFGCPYPPLSILMAMPGYLLGGDFRYAQLVALTLAAALMASARGGRVAFAATALFLLTPRGFFVLQQGWTEPFIVLLLAGTVFVACRRPGWTPVMLGLLLASKQYIFIVMPAMLLLAPRPWLSRGFWRFWAIAGATALIVTLPMVLWNVREFANSALNIRDVFRGDSLSYLAGIAAWTGWKGGGWVKFIALIPAAWLVLRKSPRTPAGFAAAVGLLLMIMFAFAPHAAANYYFGCIGAMCCAVAAGKPERIGTISAGPRQTSYIPKGRSGLPMFEIT